MEDKEIIFKSGVTRQILINLNENKVNFGSQIAREIGRTYAHTTNEIKMSVNLDLIRKVRRQGKFKGTKYNNKRRKYYELTNKGERIVEMLLNIYGELKKE